MKRSRLNQKKLYQFDLLILYFLDQNLAFNKNKKIETQQNWSFKQSRLTKPYFSLENNQWPSKRSTKRSTKRSSKRPSKRPTKIATKVPTKVPAKRRIRSVIF